MILFTADTHFNHANIIRYCGRPFKTLEEMNEMIIKNWNVKVGPTDTVYHLGDFGFKPFQEITEQLNGNIWLLMGSHDKDIKKPVADGELTTKTGRIQMLHALETVRFPLKGDDLVTIVLCHYAMRVWPFSHYGSWHLYGHSHGKLESQGKSFDVGVDCHGFAPLTLAEVEVKMRDLPENFNYVGDRWASHRHSGENAS